MTHKVDCICAACEAGRARPAQLSTRPRWVKELVIYALVPSNVAQPGEPVVVENVRTKIGRAWLCDDGRIQGRFSMVPLGTAWDFEIVALAPERG